MEEGAEQLPGVSSKKTTEREITTLLFVISYIRLSSGVLSHNL